MKSTLPLITIKNISKAFQTSHADVAVLKDVSLEVTTGDFLMIVGPSGCGKSTLLHVILGLEQPSAGSVRLLGKEVYDLTEDGRSYLRKESIGMVYQQPHWIRALSVVENVAFPLLLLGVEKNEAVDKAGQLLKSVGMAEWSEYVPTELSSGQQQRISLARALIHNPELIIADEPTGNLDFENGQILMQTLAKLNQEHGKTIIMVTHDLEYLPFANKAVKMLDGRIVEVVTGKQSITNITEQ